MQCSKKNTDAMALYEIDLQDAAYAELVACGWKKYEAAMIAYNPRFSSESELTKLAKSTERLHPGIVRYISDLNDKKKKADEKKLKNSETQDKSRGYDKSNNAEKEYDLLTKDGMLAYLVDLSNNPSLDLKSKTDLAKQISDLMQFKKEEIKIEDNRIHFYLPLTCSKCSLYQAKKRKMELEKQLKTNSEE